MNIYTKLDAYLESTLVFLKRRLFPAELCVHFIDIVQLHQIVKFEKSLKNIE